MGLGPNGTPLLPRIGVTRLEGETLEQWVRSMQVERASARALGALKRREAKPKAPKPRKHKHHCPCPGVGGGPGTEVKELCCRCLGLKCLKPKKQKKAKAT